MSLEKTIEETRAALEAAQAKEQELIDAVETTPEPSQESEPSKPEEMPEPEAAKPDIEAPVEKTASDYARERRERASQAAMYKEALEAANARIAALEEAAKPKQKVDAEPDKNEDPVAYFEWKARQQEKLLVEQGKKLEAIERETIMKREEEERKVRKERAVGELVGFEQDAKAKIADYEDAKRFYANSLAHGIKMLAPNITTEQLIDVVNERIITRAAELMREGHSNPVIALYDEAKLYGYTKTDSPKENSKPNLVKISEHRSRNAGMAAAGGRGTEGDLTPTSASAMTAGEWSKLTPEQKRAVFSQLRSG